MYKIVGTFSSKLVQRQYNYGRKWFIRANRTCFWVHAKFIQISKAPSFQNSGIKKSQSRSIMYNAFENGLWISYLSANSIWSMNKMSNQKNFGAQKLEMGIIKKWVKDNHLIKMFPQIPLLNLPTILELYKNISSEHYGQYKRLNCDFSKNTFSVLSLEICTVRTGEGVLKSYIRPLQYKPTNGILYVQT